LLAGLVGAETTLYLTGAPEAPLVNGRTFFFTTSSATVTVTASAEDHGLFIEQRGWVKVDASRRRLRGLTVERAKASGSPVRLTTTIRFRGRPTTEGTIAGSSISTGRCTRTLIDCLRDELSD
jgi:hypothetical protein